MFFFLRSLFYLNIRVHSIMNGLSKFVKEISMQAVGTLVGE